MPSVVLKNQRSFLADSHVSILDSALGHGMVLEHSCRSGRCGVCKAGVLSGETVLLRPEESLTDAERQAGRILTCCRAAASDVELDIADLSRLRGVVVRTLPCRIAGIELAGHDVVRVALRLPPTQRLPYLAGQYIDIIARGVRRSYSIANSPSADGHLELQIRRFAKGILSRYWFEEAAVGDLLRFEGPLGTFFYRGSAAGPLVFLATGTGIAPVKALLEDIAADSELAGGRPIFVYWGNRAPEDLYWRPEFGGLDITFVPVLSRAGEDWSGRRGHVQNAALADFGNFSGAEVYACGSQDMIGDAQALLTANGLSADDFYSDAFVTSH
jgi:CDP-4-dehydro-6-deoxyglucose reductase